MFSGSGSDCKLDQAAVRYNDLSIPDREGAPSQWHSI